MEDKKFFYTQYNKLNWTAQVETKINFAINRFIIKDIIVKKRGNDIKVFDIGFGVGSFLKMLYRDINKKYKNIVIGGCEPAHKNFRYFKSHSLKIKKGTQLKIYNKTFQQIKIKQKFDFITAIYVFPHFVSAELEKVVRKIYSMLDKDGKFILVVANEKYWKKKLKSQKNLFIKENIIRLNNKKYKEVLNRSELPKIGTLIDYSREDNFYLDLFDKCGFKLVKKRNLNEDGRICTIFVFRKK